MCQELLYEFATGRLDIDRQTSVDEYLMSCRDSQRELDRLKRGLRYTSFAARVQVSSELRAALMGFEPQWKKTLRGWTLWSSQRGWRLLPYIFVAATAVVGLLVSKPWRAPHHDEFVLIEQLKTEPDILSPPANVKIEPAHVLTSSAAPPALPRPEAASPLSQITPTAEPVESPRQEPTDAAEIAHRGALTRGDLEVSDFSHTWLAIREKIQALGGKVAGNVELGWLRHKDEAYFHFSIPESNRQELDLFLKTFGPVRFSTERHPRVMPEGEIRIILTVKDGGSTHEEGPTETP